MNKDSWNKLPANLKKVFNEYPFEEKLAAMWNDVDIDGKKLATEKGIQFIELSSVEIKKWKKAVEPVIDTYVKKMVDAGFQEKEIRGMIQYTRTRIDYWTKKQKELGVKSSTGPAEVRLK
jgi:TRAP-type C4-dicarboxylate transport system substrate-binding protein